MTPVYTGRVYGPYIEAQTVHPYVRAIYMGRTYGPYIRVVCSGLEA